MAPAHWARPEDLSVKQEAYHNMMTTVHWPANGAMMFKNIPLDPDKDFKNLPDIAKSDEAKRMAGVIPYEHEPGDLPDWKPQYDKRYDWIHP